MTKAKVETWLTDEQLNFLKKIDYNRSRAIRICVETVKNKFKEDVCRKENIDGFKLYRKL